jgi:hypothetical protein
MSSTWWTLKELFPLANAVRRDKYPMQTLMVGIVTSYPFTRRRLHSQEEASHAK